MNALLWVLRGILFVALLGLAIKNSNEVELRFYFDAFWHVPLSIVVLVALAVGVILGLMALLPHHVALRRQLAALEKRLPVQQAAGAITVPSTPVDG